MCLNQRIFWIILTLSLSLGDSVSTSGISIEWCIAGTRADTRILCRIHPSLVKRCPGCECFDENVLIIPNDHSYSSSLLVNCSAPYPITAEIEEVGQTSSRSRTNQFHFVRSAEHPSLERSFEYSLRIYGTGEGGVRHFRILPYTEWDSDGVPRTDLVEFWIFHPSKSVLVEDSKTHTIDIERGPIEGFTVIPCISPNPKIPPVLPSLSHGFKYNYTNGFTKASVEVREGEEYSCCHEECFNFRIVQRRETLVSPEIPHVVLFLDHVPFILACRSKDPADIEGWIGTDFTLPLTGQTNISSDGESHSRLTIYPGLINFIVIRNPVGGPAGAVFCSEREDNKTLHKWTLQIVDVHDNDVLQIRKPSEVSIVCSTKTEEKPQLRAVFCQGEMNCGYATAGKSDVVEGAVCGEGENCLKFNDVKHPGYSQGLLVCRVGNHSYTSQYFRGFDGILYVDWRKAPANALVEVFVPSGNVKLYPDNSYNFGCRASPFISNSVPIWIIRSKDGSEMVLDNELVEDIPPSAFQYNLDPNLHTVRESRIKLSVVPNEYDIICVVPWWNSTKSLSNLKQIVVEAKPSKMKEIIMVSSAIVILLTVPLVLIIWRLKKARDAMMNLTDPEVDQFFFGNPDPQVTNYEDESEQILATPYDPTLEIPKEHLTIDFESMLGQGEFGIVCKGRIEGLEKDVAVKRSKPRIEVGHFKEFLNEVKVMAHVGRHPFVASLLGAHTDQIREKIIYIVLEYCVHGSLDKLLRTKRVGFVDQVVNGNSIDATVGIKHDEDPENFTLKTAHLLKWAYEIASGMTYLESRNVVHADLAARNVLLDGDLTAKITDFGLSRKLMNNGQYVKKGKERLPYRWMAEESLRTMTFSSQSDVWAFGVTLWEIFSLGHLPYPGLSWSDDFVDKLRNGLRMTKPDYATPFLYQLMLNCWNHTPEKRPRFEEISKDLSGMRNSEYGDRLYL